MIYDDEWHRNAAKQARELLKPRRDRESIPDYCETPAEWPPADERYFASLEEQRKADDSETLDQEVYRLSGEVRQLRNLVLQRWGQAPQRTEHSEAIEL